MSDAQDLIDDIDRRRAERLRHPDVWSQYTRNNAIASDLPDCDRALALGLVAWDQRPYPGPEAVARMMSGRGMERVIIQDLRDEGWTIVQEQTPFQVRDRKGRVILSGRSEGKIVGPNRPLSEARSFEVKDTSWFVFSRVESEDDLRSDIWVRKWWRQCQAYMYHHGEEWMLFVLTHRRLRKHFVVHLDLGEAERLLQRAELAQDLSELLARNTTVPDQLNPALNTLEIPFSKNPKECKGCAFYQRVCFPPIVNEATLDVIDAPELEDVAARFVEIEQVGKEYESLKRKLTNDRFKGKTLACGSYVVTGCYEEQNTKAVPAKEAVPAGTRKLWHMSVIKAHDSIPEQE